MSRIGSPKIKTMKRALLFLATTFAVACGSDGDGTTPFEPENTYDNYPEFSWDYVPIYQHLNNSEDYFTDGEVEMIAKAPLTCIELQQAIRLNDGGADDKYCIENTAYEAARIKAINPKSKVLFYWHSSRDQGNYYQSDGLFITDPDDERILLKKDGSAKYETVDVGGSSVPSYYYDMRNETTRNWWSNVVLSATDSYPQIDGAFLDAVGFYYGDTNDNVYGEGSGTAMWEGYVTALERIKKYRKDYTLTIVNGYEDVDSWNGSILPYCEGAMLEHFCGLTGDNNKESIHAHIEKIQECGRLGKIIVVKGWPRFNFNDNSEYIASNSEADLNEVCKADIDFSLGCFLIAAGKYAYFSYGWGYDNDSGNLVDYPELYKYRLGEPLGDAVKVGDLYTREFEYAKVTVDLTNFTGYNSTNVTDFDNCGYTFGLDSKNNIVSTIEWADEPK